MTHKRMLDLINSAQAELRAMYKKLGYEGSNVLADLDAAYKEISIANESDFLVMHDMSEKNMDICASADFLNYQRDKKGGKVTIGVGNPYFDYLINQAGSGKITHVAALFIANKEQFDKIKGG